MNLSAAAPQRKRAHEGLDDDVDTPLADAEWDADDEGDRPSASPEAAAEPVESAALSAPAGEGTSTQSPAAAEPADDDRRLGVPLFGLFSGAGIAGIAMLAGGGSSSDPSLGSQSSAGGDVAVTPPGQPPATLPADPPADSTTPANPGADQAPPPPQPGLLVVQLANDTGASALDHITADRTVKLELLGADPDTTVRIERSRDGGQTWELVSDPAAPWPDGQFLVHAVVSNAGGNSTTAAVALTIDTRAPAAAELVVSGAPTHGEVQLALTGVEAGAAVAYEVSVDQGQTWHRTQELLSSLMDGQYQFRGVVTDVAGNQSFTAAQTVTVDTEPPAPLTLQLRKVGEQGWDSLSPLSCTGDVNLRLTLPAGVTARYEQSSDGGATWTAVTSSVRGLPEGAYSFRAFLQDASGNETALAAVPLTVDRTPPPAPQLSASMTAIAGDPANGYLTNDGSYQFVLSRIDPNNRVFFYMREVGTTEWKPTRGMGEDLLDGRYECRAAFQDEAGNYGYSNIIELLVDTSRPGAGTITLANFKDSGWYAFDHDAMDDNFTLVHIPNGPVASIQWQRSTDGGAHWDPTTAEQTPIDYEYVYRAIITDTQGQTHITRTISVNVNPYGVYPGTLVIQDLDDTGSNSNDYVTQDGAFTLALQNEPQGTFTVFEISDTGTGGWQPTHVQQDLPSGTYYFRAKSYEASGVAGMTGMIKVVVDRDAPSAGPLGLTDFDDTGTYGDRVTRDTSFTLTSPPLEAGATVRYSRSADGGVTWSDTTALQQDLSEGVYQFRAEVTDLAGNRSIGRPLTVTIDTTAPDAGSLSLSAGPAGHLDLQWTGPETPATLAYQVSLDQGQTWLPVAAHTDAVPAGSYLFRAVLTDAAGNAATSGVVAWEMPASPAIAFGSGDPDVKLPSDPTVVHALSNTEALWVTSFPASLAPVI